MPACRAMSAALAVLLLAGCVHRRPRPALVASPHYVLGGGYRAGQAWFYPAEHFDYEATGIAAVAADHPAGLTADGELYDAGALAGAHQTLQLPAIAQVTDLENGRQMMVRLNDRGPADPRRLIALTPRAGLLLGIPPGGAARVRVTLDARLSRALTEQLGGGPHLAIATVPRDVIEATPLAPPEVGGGGTAGPATRIGTADSEPAAIVVPERLPERVVAGPADPGTLYIELGQFSRMTYARARAARLADLAPMIDATRNGRSESFAVRAGPYASIADADAALDRAVAAGVTDAKVNIQ